MGELYEPFPKLPKNIRQIGERDNIVRVYVEDYVNTYLKRLMPKGGQDLRAGVLLGNLEEHGGVPYVFIDGALEMEGITEEGEKVNFTEESWKRAYQSMEEMFPKRTVQGWFLCGAPGSTLSPLNYWKQHGQYFSGNNKVMYLNSGLEGEEALYITSSDGFYKLRGHCIYYERNQMMQDYMVMQKDSHQVEAGGSDSVIRDFRRKMEKKKKQADSQNQAVRLLRGMCACLAILALAGGVAALNSAEKLKDMEAVMASVLPDADAVSDAGKNYLSGLGVKVGRAGEKGGLPSEGNDYGVNEVIIEEASGGVFPTLAAGGQDKEQAGEGNFGGLASNGQGEGDNVQEIPENTLGGEETQEVSSRQESQEIKDSESQNSQGEDGSADAGNGQQGQDGDGGNSQEAYAGGASGQAEGDLAASQDSNQEEALPAAAPPRQLEPAPGQSVYIVQQGETLYGICFELYQNLSKVDEICRINGLEDVNMLEAGRRLIVP